jgi:hypothetical protein
MKDSSFCTYCVFWAREYDFDNDAWKTYGVCRQDDFLKTTAENGSCNNFSTYYQSAELTKGN